MNTKISLSFLAITGALMSAEGSYAQTSHPNLQNLVTNNTFGAEVADVNSQTSFGLIDREAAQFNENDPTDANKHNSIDRNEVNSRAKNREVGTADLDAKIDRHAPRSDRSSQQSVFESDKLDRDLTPPQRGNSIHINDANNSHRSNPDPEDIARRNLSVPNLSSPQSVDIARRNLSVPNLSSPQSVDIARRNLSVPNLSSPQSADAARRNLSIPNLSSPKSDSDKLGIRDHQTSVFSGDVAIRASAPKSKANQPSNKEISIAIPVPPPRTRQTTKSHLVTPTPKIASVTTKPKVTKSEFAPVSFQQSHRFTSDVAVIDRSNQKIDRSTKLNPNLIAEPSPVSIAIPVATPRTQKINKVPSVTKIPVIAQSEPIDPVAAEIPMGQDGYPTPVAKAKPTSPTIPMGQAGYPIPVAKAKPISPTIPMGQAGYPIPVAKAKPTSPAIPMGQAGYVNTPTARSTPLSPLDGGMTTSSAVAIYPLQNPAPITSKFGWRTHPLTGHRRFHSGVDIGAPMGAPVVATGSGTVISAGWKGGYGKAVIIEHNGVQQTLYGHLSEISVQAGQTIAQGTVVGLVGSTGNSTGPHLHFETRTSSSDGWVATDPSEEVNYAMDTLQRSMPYVRRDLPSGF